MLVYHVNIAWRYQVPGRDSNYNNEAEKLQEMEKAAYAQQE